MTTNKTKYFRLRHTDEVRSERPKRDQRLTWDWPETDLRLTWDWPGTDLGLTWDWPGTDLMKIESSGQTFTEQTDRRRFAFTGLLTEPKMNGRNFVLEVRKIYPPLRYNTIGWNKCNVTNTRAFAKEIISNMYVLYGFTIKDLLRLNANDCPIQYSNLSHVL